MSFTRFPSREQAGRQLAGQLSAIHLDRPIIAAIARGGVPVGYAIASSLHAPLMVVVVRKLGAPFQPEFAIGAIAPDNVVEFNQAAIEEEYLPPDQLIGIIDREREELNRRLAEYAPYQSAIFLENRPVILVDDGLATGMTMRAAMRFIRQQQPSTVTIAVPVCAPPTAQSLRPLIDNFICLSQPDNLVSVGLWFQDFHQVTDKEVISLLQKANK